MSDRLPGSSYSNPIMHRGWRIYLSDLAVVHGYEWDYVHDDYDGADDANDHRCGQAHTVEEAKAEIDHHEQEALLESFEAGEMGAVEFTELALDLGMSLTEIGTALEVGSEL